MWWGIKVFLIFLVLGPFVDMLLYGLFAWSFISGYHSEGGAYLGVFFVLMADTAHSLGFVFMLFTATVFYFWTKKALTRSKGQIPKIHFVLFGAASGFGVGCVTLPFLGGYGFMIALVNSFSSAVCGGLCAFLDSPISSKHISEQGDCP